MRRAQEVLDGALAERSRTLAAFAVTVGDDGAIADLLGLNEREVRLARRTVGRTDARSVAEALLNHTPNAAAEVEEPAPAPEIQLPHPRDEMAGSPVDVPPLAEAPPPVMHAPEGDSMPLWTPSMDSVLLWSWESGVDLQTVASELGVSVRALLMRVQALADDGMLTLVSPVPDAVRSGRHRRQYEETTSALFAATSAFPAYMPY